MSIRTVVKRSGNDEVYDEKKLYGSIFLSLRVANHQEKESEIIAPEVTKIITKWLDKKTHVTAHDLRMHAAQQLADYNKTAAYLYKHHRVLS